MRAVGCDRETFKAFIGHAADSIVLDFLLTFGAGFLDLVPDRDFEDADAFSAGVEVVDAGAILVRDVEGAVGRHTDGFGIEAEIGGGVEGGELVGAADEMPAGFIGEEGRFDESGGAGEFAIDGGEDCEVPCLDAGGVGDGVVDSGAGGIGGTIGATVGDADETVRVLSGVNAGVGDAGAKAVEGVGGRAVFEGVGELREVFGFAVDEDVAEIGDGGERAGGEQGESEEGGQFFEHGMGRLKND